MAEEMPLTAEYLNDFGLPVSIESRGRNETQRVRDLWSEHEYQTGKMGRNFHLGLLIAFIAMVEETCARLGVGSYPSALDEFPPQEQNQAGRKYNTLNLPVPGGSIKLRGFYDRAQNTIKLKLARRGYPSSAPHATQAWPQHRSDIETLFAMSGEERAALLDLLWRKILAMPRPAYRTANAAQERPFLLVLQEFGKAKGEPAGAVLQALVYAYFNVELAHLTAIEASKVRTGGARRGNIGDIDGWDAAEAVVAVEVKDLDLGENSGNEMSGFLSNLTDWPDATAIVIANSFSEEVRENLLEQNVLPVTKTDLIEDVRRWDMPKQRRAIRALDYYIVRVESNDRLSARFREFVVSRGITTD